jgi:hypothetical protein
VRRGRRRQDPSYFDQGTGRPLPARRVIRQKVSRTLRSTFDLSGQRAPAPDAKRRAANDRARRDAESSKSQAARDADDVALRAMGLASDDNDDDDGDKHNKAAPKKKPLPSTNPELSKVDAEDDNNDSINWALVAQGKQRPSIDDDAAPAAQHHNHKLQQKQRTDSQYEKVPPQVLSSAAADVEKENNKKKSTTTTTTTTAAPAAPAAKKVTAAKANDSKRQSTYDNKRSSLAMPPVPPDMPLTLELPTIDLDLGATSPTAVASFRVDEPPPTPPHELHDDDDDADADDDDLPAVPDMVRSPSPPEFDVTGAPYDATRVSAGDDVDDNDDDLPPVPDEEPPPFQPLDIDLV